MSPVDRLMPRRTALLLGLALGLAPAAACKRRETQKIQIFDEATPPALTEALGALAPPWPAPERVVLGDGLLVHWLREPETPAVHLRLLLPTAHLKPVHQGAPAFIAARAVAHELEALASRLAIRVELAARPGRFEVAIHGVDVELDAILAALGDVFTAELAGPLARARKVALAELRPLDSEAIALAALTNMLLGTPIAAERVAHADVQDVLDITAQHAWEALTDPRRALLVVHAGDALEQHEPALGELAGRWRQRVGLIASDADAEPQALVRLRGEAPPRPPALHLKKTPTAPLTRLDPAARGRGALVLARTIDTPTARDRSLARLVQRRLQEELDVRLSVQGGLSLLTIHVPLQAAGRGKPPPDPLEQTEPEAAAAEPTAEDPLVRRVRRELTVIRDFLRERPLAQELLGAAQLWLGARMVGASLAGEDWTGLWSEALDLSSADGEIAAALARDAQTMLAATPDDAAAFAARWLDLETSEPGWAWVVVGPEAELKGVVASQAKGIQFEPPPEG